MQLHPYPTLARDRTAAVVTGVLGALLAICSAFLPVRQDVATVEWTAGRDFQPVTAPLVAGRPLDLDVTIPCAGAAAAGDTAVLVSTLPAGSPGMTSDGLVVSRGRTAAGVPSVEVVVRNLTLLSIPVDQLRDPACRGIHITSDIGTMVAEAEGLTHQEGADRGQPMRTAVPGVMRPQVVGVFTGLDAATAPRALQDIRVHLTVDNRYSSSPTPLKLVLMVIGVLCTLASVVFLHRLDGVDGRRDRRFWPAHWTRIAPVDAVVTGVLVLWHIIGANTSDDGYLLTMARSAGPSGYMANYYRWLGSPESPVGWYYEILKALASISTASPFIRLPTLLCGILSWLIISREVVPRLGRLARRWKRPQWTGAAVFLTFWMAFDNGLRPEPVIALGALLTWSLVERSIATRRLVPAVAAVGVAAFSLGTGPTGLMCVAALAAGLRPVAAVARRRARLVGWPAILAPTLAVGLALLYTVFADQTLAAVSEATRVRTELGPSLPWYGEKERWIALFGVTADGSLARRFPILIMLLCLALVAAVMLRRGRIPGVATGPSRRLVGVLAGSLFLLVFTPTKWTHHFGVFAGLGGALAVLTVLALRPRAISLPRNRWLIGAALALTVGVASATVNRWWYVSAYGTPFSDSFPALGPLQLNYAAFAACLFCLAIAGLLHTGLMPTALLARLRDRLPARLRSGVGTATGATPLTVVAFALVLFELAGALTAVVVQAPAYTVGRSNTRALLGHPCALADSVLVEEDSNDGLLQPVGATPATALGAGGSEGFAPNGLPDSVTTDTAAADQTGDEDSGGTQGAQQSGSGSTAQSGTTARTGSGAETINGSTVPLPFGLDPAATSVLGSYRRGPQVAAELTSSWYELPARSANRPLLVLAAAGQVGAGDITVEYGRPGKVGRYGPGDYEVMGSLQPIDPGPGPAWRNLRIPLESIPADAEVVRVVARDINLSPDWWMAVTPPRTPRLRTLDEVVGHTDPVLIDWVVGLAFPCQRPYVHRDGIAEIPRYRILADRDSATVANWWQGATGGGPLLWIQQTLRPTTVPAYLDHDWARDWGSLQRYTPIAPRAVPATVDRQGATRWGWSTPGPMDQAP